MATCWKTPVTPRHSLRRLLLLWLLPLVMVMLGLSMVGDYKLAIEPAIRAYDQSLLDSAAILADHLATGSDGEITLQLSEDADRILHTEEFDQVYYAAYDESAHLLAGTAGLLQPEPSWRRRGARQFYDVVWQGQPLRLLEMHHSYAGHDITLQVAETTNKRRRLSRQIVLGMLLPELLTVASVMIAVWIGVGRGLAPLERLQRLVVSGGGATKRLPESQAPSELYGLVHVHNLQADKLKETLDLQEHFITNAAHQLRTPLAGLQAQSELALRLAAQAGDSAELQRIITNIHTAAERCSRLAQQMLSLARSSSSSGMTFLPIDLATIAEQVATRSMADAQAATIDLGLELAPAPVTGIEGLLEEMLSNLVDNAMRYCPPHSSITVITRVKDGCSELVVEDNGPGIPVSEHLKVFERFYRLDATKRGAGLGLAIVREIATLHRAQINLESASDQGGLRVIITFQKAGGEGVY